MRSILKQIQSYLSLVSFLFFFSSNTFASFDLIKDLRSSVETQIINYLQSDPECHSCRGNKRSAGIHYLEYRYNSDNGQEYLRGKVWANSCQDFKNGIYAYGDPDASLGHCGYHEVQFLLPIIKNAGDWTANFERITTDLEDGRTVQKITPCKFEKHTHDGLMNMITSGMLKVAKNDPRYPPLQIDVEQIFKLCRSHLESSE